MSHNTWLHRAVRASIVKPLARTPVTPNQLTIVHLIAGLVAAGLLATGDPSLVYAGAAAYLIALLLDRTDGELARYTGRTTPYGHKLDLIVDGACNALIFVGLGIGLRSGDYGDYSILMGILAGASVALIFRLVMFMEKVDGERAGEIGAAAGFDPDDALFVVPVAIWLGHSETLLLAASIGAPVFALLFIVLFRKKLFGRAG